MVYTLPKQTFSFGGGKGEAQKKAILPGWPLNSLLSFLYA